MISLKSAIKFHGHLGPWLVIGLCLGDYALKKIKAKRYFGLSVIARIPNHKPISCLIDGLQLSTGCTLGKDNIRIINDRKIRVNFINKKNKKNIALGINYGILERLSKLKSHDDSESLAKHLYRTDPEHIVKIIFPPCY